MGSASFLFACSKARKKNYQDVKSGGNFDNLLLSLAAEFLNLIYLHILFHHDPFSTLAFCRLSFVSFFRFYWLILIYLYFF